jgi:Xaa-Pro aminopeptidase
MKTALIQEYMKKKAIDYCLFFNFDRFNANMFYFSGYSSVGCLVIPKKGRQFIICPRMDAEAARKTKNRVIVYEKEFFQVLLRNIGGAKKLGVEKNQLSVLSYSRIRGKVRKQMADISVICQKLRQEKTNAEISKIRKCCNLSSKIVAKCIKNFNFKTEVDVSAFLEYEARKAGADVAFPIIVASGKNASMPHHNTSTNKLLQGFLIIDFGVKIGGYCSDNTWTFYIGKPTEKEILLYNKVMDCQTQVIGAIKPNKRCKTLSAIGDKILAPHKMIHSYGHGIGIEVHEGPAINPNSKEKLAAGNVLSVEPAIYVAGKFGIRLESMVAVTEKGFEYLCKIPSRLITIKQKVY